MRELLDRAFLERFPGGVKGQGVKLASDNGSAFLSETIQEVAGDLEVELIRTRRQYPEGNGRCERLIRTIKEEEVWLNLYESFREAELRINRFVQFYNAERVHSALGYRSPRQYAALWREQNLPAIQTLAGLREKHPKLVLT